MKTSIYLSINCLGEILSFNKKFDLPFSPFYGMGITFGENKKYSILLKNDDCYETVIFYNTIKNIFEIDIKKELKYPAVYLIDHILDKYSSWERTDDLNIDKLKKKICNNIEYR
jgi:hypothetical protein